MKRSPSGSVRGVDPSGGWLSGGSALITAVVLSVTAGVAGLGAGALVVILWYWLPVTATFAIGQIIALALLPADSVSMQLVLVELGLTGILFGSIYHQTRSAKTFGIATVPFVVFLGLFWLTRNWSTWLTAMVIVGSAGFLLYGTHRYELTKLDLVENPSSGQ